MADNVAITPGSGTDVATDEIGGKHYQRIKLAVGDDGTGVDVSHAEPLPVTTPGLEIAKGALTGHKAFYAFGRNEDINTGTDPEDVWTPGGLWVAPTAARIHDIVSASANDDFTAPGTGAQKILVEGLGATFLEQSETVEMNGASNVATVLAYTRINRLTVTVAGSGLTNAGIITATAQSDSTLTAEIGAGKSKSESARYTVPAAKSAYMTGVYGAIKAASGGGSADDAEFAIIFRPAVDVATSPVVEDGIFPVVDGGSSAFSHKFDPPRKYEGKTDILLRVVEVSTNDTHVSGGFDLIIVDD